LGSKWRGGKVVFIGGFELARELKWEWLEYRGYFDTKVFLINDEKNFGGFKNKFNSQSQSRRLLCPCLLFG